MRARYYKKRLRGRGTGQDGMLAREDSLGTNYVLVPNTRFEESKPKPIASQSNNERKLVKMIEEKIESNSIIDKKKSKPKRIEYISTQALLT